MRLDRATGREGRGIEIEHHRPLLERVFQRERHCLAGEADLSGEIWRRVAHLERSLCSGDRKRGQHEREAEGRTEHGGSPSRGEVELQANAIAGWWPARAARVQLRPLSRTRIASS